MKNKLLIVLLLIVNYVCAQSEIENPLFSSSTVHGKVAKVELLKDGTVLHFDVTLYSNKPCHIPSVSYIQPVGSDKKYFVTHAEGVVLDEEFEVPGGKLKKKYKLYFPKLPDDVTHVKFDEFEHGNWEIHDLEIKGFKDLPKELVGNWLKADGSNLWGHSLYNNFAVLDSKKWNYESINKKGNNFVLTLERKGEKKVMYAKVTVNGIVNFGLNKKELTKYSLQKINNSNFKEKEEVANTGEILKKGIATYSGLISGFSKNSSQKTGKISVNNLFTGDQDSHLIEIKDDGSFTVSFPSYHLQQVYVELPGSYSAIYVEPGKETKQLINSNDRTEGFFAGDLAQLNTDFASLNFLVFDSDYYNMSKNIKDLTPQDYKEACFKIQDSQLRKLDSVAKIQFLSKQAYELMAVNLKYRAYQSVLSYDMKNRTPHTDSANVDIAYMDFITPDILNNKNAIQTSSYTSFINRLRFLRHLRKGIRVTHPNVVELGELLKDKRIELTDSENELLMLHNKYNVENATAIKKQSNFNEKHKAVLSSIGQKYGNLYQKMNEDERKKFFNGTKVDLSVIEDFAKSKDIDVVFTTEEKEYQKASEKLLSKEEKERFKSFNSEENNKRKEAFTKKYKTHIDEFVRNEFSRQGLEKIREYYGDGFSSDVMVSQQILGDLSRNFIPLTDKGLEEGKKHVADSFISDVFEIENDKLKDKIEANKTKTGYVVNDTPETEADKVFDVIMSKYKGKVVYVDFWATWCGPCRSGMERIKPLKEELKDKDVVFVYITSPSSPLNTYNNMIPDIKGEHYRVSKDEWNYLGSKFNITGIPHYLLIDKKGVVVKDNTSDLRMPESVKKMFEEYL